MFVALKFLLGKVGSYQRFCLQHIDETFDQTEKFKSLKHSTLFRLTTFCTICLTIQIVNAPKKALSHSLAYTLSPSLTNLLTLSFSHTYTYGRCVCVIVCVCDCVCVCVCRLFGLK